MRAWLYDRTFRLITNRWYAEVLERLPRGATMLDVGIGTAGALIHNRAWLPDKDIKVVGVDIDGDYVRRAQRALAAHGLTDRVRVEHTSILDFHESGFDAAYFGASFMLMPDPPGVLRHVLTMLKPTGLLYFTQTFEENRSPFIEKVKPLLHRITTIHFGKVTYERDFMDTIEGAGLTVREHTRLDGGRARSGRLIIVSQDPPIPTAEIAPAIQA